MIYYELVKVTINALVLAKVIINVVVRYYGVLESIITDLGSLFISIFWFWLCYFLGIKKSYLQLSTPKSIAKQRDKIAQWKHTLDHLLIKNKIIGQDYCQWLSLFITTPKIPAPATPHSNLIVATILKFCLKKTLTPVQDLALLTNQLKS